MLTEQSDHLAGVGVAPGGGLGVHELVVQRDLEPAARGRHQPEVGDDRRPSAEDLGRQTGGPLDVVSGDAELDGDGVRGIQHAPTLSPDMADGTAPPRRLPRSVSCRVVAG